MNILSEIPLFAWVLANLCASLFMTGVIWFVQIVHYPLFMSVGQREFAEYEYLHTRRTGYVVSGPMIFELLAAIGLAASSWSSTVRLYGLASLVLALAIWVSTFALQVPCHTRLERGFEESTCVRLVRTNWLRTVAWTARTILLLVLLTRIHDR